VTGGPDVAADEIKFVRPAGSTGVGRSRGLARGLLVYYGGLDLTGEGMGIGGVALRDRNGTCFSRSWTDSEEYVAFERSFFLDTRLVWGIGGRPLPFLSRLIGVCVDAYMKVPRLQGRVLSPALKLRTMLGITPLFIAIPSRGTISLRYEVNDRRVAIRVSGTVKAGSCERLCILNELSAAWFTSGLEGGSLVPPPPGWHEIDPHKLPVYLADPSHGIGFSIGNPSVEPPSHYRIYEGREDTGDLCWAGFCIEVGPPDLSGKFPELRYSVGLVRGTYL
jgi:hypothetical protein